jgi:hypothetical protein
MRRLISYLTPLFALLLVVGLAGCQDSMVSPEPQTDDEPISEQEFRDRMEKDGMVVFDESEYDAFGIELKSPGMVERMVAGEAPPKTKVCTNRFSGGYSYSVCSEVNVVQIYNVDYFRVQIDATIDYRCPIYATKTSTKLRQEDQIIGDDGEPVETIEPIDPIDPIDPFPCVEPLLSITSNTVRNDGVVLQNNDSITGGGPITKSFVAAYPTADSFSFNHSSEFQPVNDVINVTVTP